MLRAGRERSGSIRSSATPRDALSTTNSSPVRRAASAGRAPPGRRAVSSRSPSARGIRARAPARTPPRPRAGPGSSSTSAARDLRDGAPADPAPSSRIVPATNTSRRPPRSARGGGDRGAERRRIGVVAVVEDREPARSGSARPGRPAARTARAPGRRRAVESERLRPPPTPAWRSRPGAAPGPPSVNALSADGEHRPGVGPELDPVGHQVGALRAPRSARAGRAAGRPRRARRLGADDRERRRPR